MIKFKEIMIVIINAALSEISDGWRQQYYDGWRQQYYIKFGDYIAVLCQLR